MDIFKLDGISYSFQTDQPVSVYGALCGIFHFYTTFDRNFCKQTVAVVSDLGLHFP